MSTTYTALRFRTTQDAEDKLQGFLLTHATIEGIEEAGGEVLYYLPHDEWTLELQREVEAFASATPGISFLGSEDLENRDWNAEWEQSIEPQRPTGKLVIAPSWRMDEARAMNSEYLITIDPKMSFGTGHHETTRLCLGAIEALDIQNRSVLDIGTGSGVLAIYALLRGARSAIGVDTDSWAVENAEENRDLNHISDDRFTLHRGTLGTVVPIGARFDLILANIHRNVLIEIAPDIHRHGNARANVILSGLLMYDVEEVRAVYESAGFEFVREDREHEWASLTLTC